jgi:glucose/arabinose dehydrogenase
MRSGAALLLALTWSSLAFAAPGERPGEKFSVKIQDLPKPYATDAVDNSSEKIARPANATLSVPEGFRASTFAEGLERPRHLAVAPNGDVFVALSKQGEIVLLRDENGDGHADQSAVYATGFARPHGMLFDGGFVYIADTTGLWRIPYAAGDTKAGDRTKLTPDGAFGGDRDHWTRNIALSRDKKTVFVAIGSENNVAEEKDPHATVQVMPLAGGKPQTFARGLRNPADIALSPGTDDIYVVVNERDGLGDGLVPDYLTHVERGAFYGWPYAYLGPTPDPDWGAKRPDLVAQTKTPDVLFQAHSAPVGLTFYTGTQFPAEYRGSAFVSLHGSWNSGKPTGYKIVRVPFANGRPTANAYENFATGFWAGGTDKAQVWGRPVGLAVAKDGALLVADDVGGVIWRISYGK